MNLHYSILHISDLHKGENNDFKHLFSSLCNDADTYDQSIPRPAIIVVSGDLAEGANGEGAAEKIQQQYREVEAFLNELVDYFLEGDKRRIIIVPGNHDLFRGATIDSMEEVPMEARELAKREYFKGHSKYRWSWDDFKFYYIHRDEDYASRFKFFVEFYNRFYEGIREIRDCDRLNEVVDLPAYNISFALFNSCHRIDHLNQIGAICTDAIAGAQQELSRMYRYGRFIIGVWHHNISGIPSQTNYLDPRILHSLTDFHIQVGLYGHQHHAEVLYEYRDIFKQGRMSLISSGCLYGRGKTMPPGTHCQYNIIEINQDREQDKVDLILHVREDETGWDIPSWRMKHIDGKESFLMTFDLPKANFEKIFSDLVSIAKSEGRHKEAIAGLLQLRDKVPTADKFIDEFLKELPNPEILELSLTPNTEPQAISLLGACIEAHDLSRFDKTLESVKEKGIGGPMIKVLIEESKKIR